MVKLVFCCRRRPGTSREEFQRYWLERHGPLVKSLRQALPQMRRYVQSHTLDTPVNAAIRAGRGTGPEYDGITEVWFDAAESLLGPATAEGFSLWAGIGAREAHAAFEALGSSLVPVRTPVGDAFVREDDEPLLRAPVDAPAAARLLPSGDVFYLLQGLERELLVPDEQRRNALWTPRVWPGALLVGGDVAGTWRRAGSTFTVGPWRRLSSRERSDVEAEAATLPLPDVHGAVSVRWEGR